MFSISEALGLWARQLCGVVLLLTGSLSVSYIPLWATASLCVKLCSIVSLEDPQALLFQLNDFYETSLNSFHVSAAVSGCRNKLKRVSSFVSICTAKNHVSLKHKQRAFLKILPMCLVEIT